MPYLAILERSLAGRASLVGEHRGGRGDVKTTRVDVVTVRAAGSCYRGPAGVRGLRVSGLGLHRQAAVEAAVDAAPSAAVAP